jgi:2-amino-4-hydroxy-6-hydroxymethyldihydropteridine diphosphokinase
MKDLHHVFLAIGSNVGCIRKNIEGAYKCLSHTLKDLQISHMYVTEPKYLLSQPPFLNAVLKGTTDLSPFALLEECHSIEKKYGRNRSKEVRMGPRPLDIDILLYGEKIIRTDRLIIPHLRLRERKFVLTPLLEIEPEQVDPLTGIKLWKFLNGLPRQGIYYSSITEYTNILR